MAEGVGRVVGGEVVAVEAAVGPPSRDEATARLQAQPHVAGDEALGVIASKLRVLLGECGVDGAKVLTNAFGCYRLELPEGSWVDILAATRGAEAAEAALAAGQLGKAKVQALRTPPKMSCKVWSTGPR